MAKAYDFKKAVDIVNILLADKQRQIDFGEVVYVHLYLFEEIYDWRKSIPVYSDGEFDKNLYSVTIEWFEDFTPVLIVDYAKGETDFINCYIEK